MENTLLNLIPSSYIPEVHLSQYDIGRELTFKLMDGNTEYSVPSGAVVTVKATKPSGLGFVVNAEADGNIVTLSNTETMTNESGRFSAELSISNGSTLLGTSNFIFNVERSPHPEGTTDGDAEALIPELTLLINEARSLVEQAEETAQTVTGLEPRVSANETAINVLDARMNAFASLPDGSTTGDAELIDIRVGADGTIYPTAGDSVRGQITALEDVLNIKRETETVYNSYASDGNAWANMSVAPFITHLMDYTGAPFNISGIKLQIMRAGTLSIGVIPKNKVVQGGTFDPNDVTNLRTVSFSETGVRSISFEPFELDNDHYLTFGTTTDTCQFLYGGTNTPDVAFLYVSGGRYTFGSSRLGVDVFTTKVGMIGKSTYNGKTLSILGDSISTFDGYIPSGNATYYPSGTVQQVTDTWWKKLIDALGMTLKVNNSWSGSRVTDTNGTASAGCGDRAESLGEDPDVIIIWMGINDFNGEVALGTYNGQTTIPTATNTFREAYAVMLNKVLTKYKNSEVWVCTLPQCERNAETGFPEVNGNGIALIEFNKAIVELANAFGVKVLDHNKCGLTYQNMPVYNPDNLHPNKEGHSLISNNDIWQMDNFVRTRY